MLYGRSTIGEFGEIVTLETEGERSQNRPRNSNMYQFGHPRSS